METSATGQGLHRCHLVWLPRFLGFIIRFLERDIGRVCWELKRSLARDRVTLYIIVMRGAGSKVHILLSYWNILRSLGQIRWRCRLKYQDMT